MLRSIATVRVLVAAIGVLGMAACDLLTGNDDDGDGPTVTANQLEFQQDPVNTEAPNVQFHVVFSSAVEDFTSADVSMAGSTAPGPLSVLVTGNLTHYVLYVSGFTGPGTLQLSVPAGVAHDAQGRPNRASTSTDNVVTVVPMPAALRAP